MFSSDVTGDEQVPTAVVHQVVAATQQQRRTPTPPPQSPQTTQSNSEGTRTRSGTPSRAASSSGGTLSRTVREAMAGATTQLRHRRKKSSSKVTTPKKASSSNESDRQQRGQGRGGGGYQSDPNPPTSSAVAVLSAEVVVPSSNPAVAATTSVQTMTPPPVATSRSISAPASATGDSGDESEMESDRGEGIFAPPRRRSDSRRRSKSSPRSSSTAAAAGTVATTTSDNKNAGDGNTTTATSTSTSTASDGGGTDVMTKPPAAKKHDEKRFQKFMKRFYYGMAMFHTFGLILYSGHVYICALITLLQILLFRELVKVRYNTYFHRIEQTIPLFRTTQWLWFSVAIFYTYSDFAVDMIKSNTNLHYLIPYAESVGGVSFVWYSGTFVLTIATMQIGHIRFQLNQLCWTIVVLCLVVGQLKYIMHNVYNGLIWFALPVMLVITNDCSAYFWGMTCGRKFIRRDFISLSPNKTWEGFVGAGLFTLIMAWYLSRFMAHFKWMTCPTNVVTFRPHKLTCEPHHIFMEENVIFSPQIFEILPSFAVKMIPGVVEICSVNNRNNVGSMADFIGAAGTSSSSPLKLTNCISGDPTHTHHHFELILTGVLPVQLHALSLAMFASLVAPFGGFLASGIKRAYNIKDFDSIIPGHGGMMDRMDCQFLMALCTWVHYNTFVKITTVSVPKMLYMYKMLSESEKEDFLMQITKK